MLINGGQTYCTFWEICNTREGLNKGLGVFWEKQGSLYVSGLGLLSREMKGAPPFRRLGRQWAGERLKGHFRAPCATISSVHEWKGGMANTA